MNFISFSLSINHIFFILIFVVFFFRELSSRNKDKLLKENEKSKAYFGKTKSATTKLFNIYVYTISNFFSFFAVCIIKIRTKRNYRKSNEIEEEHSSKSFNYIYSGSPVKTKKLLKRTFLLTLFDFIAQFIVFFFFFIINNDKKIDLKDRSDMLCIFNIISKYIFSKLFLKSTKYYRHHYLSLAINIFCLIILGGYEFIKLEKNKENLIMLSIRILSQIIYSLEDVVGKLALIEEFLSPYTLIMYKGIYEIFLLLIVSIPFFFIKRDNSIIFSKMDVLMNSSHKILSNVILMLMNFLYCTLIWVIIDRFSPNDYSMSMVIEGLTQKLYQLILEREEFTLPLSIYVIIIYIILIIGLCIYSEIIIINRCGLNEYTKQNFEDKGVIDYQLTMKADKDRSSLESLDEGRKRDSDVKRAITREMEFNHNKLSINGVEDNNRAKSISSFLMGSLDLIPEEKDN